MKLDYRTLGLTTAGVLVGAVVIRTVSLAALMIGEFGLAILWQLGAFLEMNQILIWQAIEVPLILGLFLLARFIKPSLTGLLLVLTGLVYNAYELLISYVDSLHWNYPFQWQVLFDLQTISKGIKVNAVFGLAVLDLLSFAISLAVILMGVLLLSGAPAQQPDAADQS